MSDIRETLRRKSFMIRHGEKINPFSECDAMDEAIAEITRLNAIIADMKQVGDIQQMIIDSEVTK